MRPGITRSLARKFLDLGLKDAYHTDVLGFEKKKHGVPWLARKLAPALSAVEREKMWVDGQLTQKHSQVWAEAKTTRADWVVVLEDDALPAQSLASQLVQVVCDAVEFSLRYADLGGGIPKRPGCR